jgi:hypothetical protein
VAIGVHASEEMWFPFFGRAKVCFSKRSVSDSDETDDRSEESRALGSGDESGMNNLFFFTSREWGG